MDKKIFIYEDSKGFSSLLKHYYANKIIIDSSKDKNFIAQNYGDYQACFFMINNVRDYIIFEKVINKIKTLFVITPIKLYEHKITSMQKDNIIILDFNDDIKRNIMKTINFNLELNNII